ncbi:LOW QUALITY PROTEIN: odorant receptor 46a [Harpegnathos saltator]|uniref:LOW QUALITY PROTEIN: odorant receptor 46a n=1 Tax=Harpegnathos saltator TaxID=610380 RepID=UPI000948BBB2|nr:LOW QUALITY PROTEIN: odorant receptor 46a [Harpegnathos saltator]
MRILHLNFLFYTVSGVWRPIEWSSNCSKLLYSLFTVMTIYLLNFAMLTQLMDIILVIDNMDDFATTNILFFSSALCKAITAVIRRDQIVNLTNILQGEPCKACNEEETAIQTRYDRLIRSCSIGYIVLASLSATGATVGEVFAVLQGELPHRGWVPYDYNSPFLFLLTSLQEMLSLILGTTVNIATETLVLGFCLQTCAQLEILTHRLHEMTRSRGSKEASKSLSNKASQLARHIHHHLCIIRFAKMVNEVFSEVVFVQFFGSILILCSTVYYLSSHVTLEDFANLAVYTICMFVQILFYCWAGNEVILKSTGLSEAVYHTDWMLLTISERKDLLMIMKRSTRPIQFNSSFLVTLSLESYGNILKTSYSAFNVLQQS